MNLDNIIVRIGVPLKTPLCALFRARGCWHVWTAVRDYQQPYSKWEGTYICLYDDGRTQRVTVYDDGHEDTMEIKRADT